MSILSRRRLLLSYIVEKVQTLQLYLTGNQYTSVTGGWKKTFTTQDNAGTFTANTSYLTLSNSSTSGYSYARRTSCVTQSKINTTGYKYVYARITSNVTNSNGKVYLGLYTSSTGRDTSYTTQVNTTLKTSSVTLKLPVTSYQGSYYIGIMAYKPVDVSSITWTTNIHEVWLSTE